jgi:hypothetical protein
MYGAHGRQPFGKMTPSVIRALSIRQPYAEQIFRGTKKIEYHTRPTRVRERVYIYASMTPGPSREFDALGVQPGDLPTGVLVGTVEIVGCTGHAGDYQWQLQRSQRLPRLRKPKRQPQPVWFHPF